MTSIEVPVRLQTGGAQIGTAYLSEWEPRKIVIELNNATVVRELIRLHLEDFSHGIVLKADTIGAKEKH